jgi:hypothetical protein
MKNKGHGSLDLARRIRAAGRAIYVAEDDGDAPYIPSDALRVYQVGGVNESSAFDWGNGTGFKIYLVITNHRPAFAISRFELELPWKTTYFQWLEDPVVIDGKSPCYRFVGNDILEFERSQVINHYADVTKPLSAGQSVKGFLLGFGYDSIPKEFPHGAMIPASINTYDQGANKHRSPVKLWADRMKKNLRPPQWTERRKGGLLDKRDKIAGS